MSDLKVYRVYIGGSVPIKRSHYVTDLRQSTDNSFSKTKISEEDIYHPVTHVVAWKEDEALRKAERILIRQESMFNNKFDMCVNWKSEDLGKSQRFLAHILFDKYGVPDISKIIMHHSVDTGIVAALNDLENTLEPKLDIYAEVIDHTCMSVFELMQRLNIVDYERLKKEMMLNANMRGGF